MTDPADNFGFRHTATRPAGPESERRLHLVALDYWHDLKASAAMPDFRQLTPDGLAPFRSVSLLLDFSNPKEDHPTEPSSAAHIRFVGDQLAGLLADQPLSPGMYTDDLSVTDFGAALLQHLQSPDSRQIPCEFEYTDALISGRGILMPLALAEKTGSFVWVVATFEFTAFKQRAVSTDPAEIFADQLARARDLAETTPSLGAGAREALYVTLQAAYELFEIAEADQVAWRALLANSGLKMQVRAPYTPALKLVFGKNYDKTRLTEYAAALGHARRNGISADRFITWIDGFPGGIKGCVDAERALKKGGSRLRRKDTSASQKVARLNSKIAQAPVLSRLDPRAAAAHTTASDTSLLDIVFVRNNADGSRDIVAEIAATPDDQKRLVKHISKALPKRDTE